MTGLAPAPGLYWHVHHLRLAEWCFDYQRRVDYIRAQKPAREIKLRLRLFQPVKAPPAPLVKAVAAYGKAWATYDKAWVAYDKASAAYDKALAAYEKAKAAYDRVISEHMPELEGLHKIECPGCPWDGRSIFSGEGDK